MALELLDAQSNAAAATAAMEEEDELEFLSAQEDFSQEHSNPFPSSCSPIPPAPEQTPPQGSVRAMVRAMEQRQQELEQRSPPAKAVISIGTPHINETNDSHPNETNDSSSPSKLPSSAADKRHDPDPEEDSNKASPIDTSAESTVAVDPHACEPIDDDEDDYWASDIIAENDSDLYEARMMEQEEAEESRMQEEEEASLNASENETPENGATKAAEERHDVTTTPLQVTTTNAMLFSPGTTVNVQSRTWPGINQPGGVATILNQYQEEGLVTYDVQYVLDRRKEKHVESIYITRHIETTPEGPRRQSPRTQATTTPARTKAAKPRSNLKKPPNRVQKRKSKEKVEPSKRQKSPKCTATLNCEFSTVEELCETADQWYQARIRSALEKGVLYVCASNLSEGDEKALKELARLVKESNVRIVQQGSIQANKTTLCVVPTSVPSSHQRNNVTAALRTMKTMQAAVLGIPLVHTAWIYNCKRAKTLSEPDSCLYIRSLPTKRNDTMADFGVSFSAAARLTLKSKYSPFAGLCFYFCGLKQQDEHNFQELLRASGIDSILNKQNLLNYFKEKTSSQQLIMVCGDATTIALPKLVQDSFQSKTSVVVASQWLVDSVSAGKALQASDYPPKSPKARVLWEISKDRQLFVC